MRLMWKHVSLVVEYRICLNGRVQREPCSNLFASRLARQVGRSVDYADHSIFAHGRLPVSFQAPGRGKDNGRPRGYLEVGKPTRQHCIDADKSAPTFYSLMCIEDAIDIEKNHLHTKTYQLRRSKAVECRRG